MSAFDNNSGKISSAVFKEVLFPQCGFDRKEVIVGPRFGTDTAVIDIGNNMGMAVSSDPLSLIPSLGLQESAWLSVHLLANDMATTGFSPMYAQFVLNLPTSFTIEGFKEYWRYIHEHCAKIGVAITGGHTGQIEGQNSTIAGGGTMFLVAPKNEIITSNRAEPGDVIIVTKETALVSTSILAMSFPKTVKQKLGKEVFDKACENFYQTSVLNEALAATELLQNNIELTAMHDVTEGGVLGAVYEMAQASACGFRIDNSSLPTGEAQARIADLFGIDHRFSVGAGAMIMAVKKEKCNQLISFLNQKSIKATAIGEFLSKESGYRIIEKDEEKAFTFNGQDPYWAAFFKAFKSGLK